MMRDGASARDTIAAISTAPGRAGVALVRVSGPAVPEIQAALGAGDLEPRRATVVRLSHPDEGHPVDRGLVTRFVAPASYTGEEMLEIGCHGGALVPQLVLDAVCAAGARRAEPGEFTRRAYLNGKMDLLQVEATLDLVDAPSEALGRAALFQLERGLSRRIEALREEMVELQALLSYEIDFPEEDEGPVPPERIDGAVGEVERRLEDLLRDAPEGEMLREGALTVIAGRPNTGKSSLFNALLGQERAIVTEVPGTTRDAIEAVLSVEGYPFRLVDTAGLRASAGRVEGRGIEVARDYLSRAELVLFCARAGRPLDGEEEAFLREWESGDDSLPRVLRVRTRADENEVAGDGHEGEIVVSAHEGTGLAELRAALLDAAYSGLRSRGEEPLVTRKRQIRALRRAREEVAAFASARERGMPPEIAVTHLQDATRSLEELLGVVDVEDVLDVLFTSFCVGK